MSAGSFLVSKYPADYGSGGEIHPVRVQPETLAASIGATANAAPSGALTNPISASVSAGRRAIGLRTRQVFLKLPVGTTPPTGYLAGARARVAGINKTFYAAAIKGASCTYLGVIWEVTGRDAEVVK